MSANAAAAGLSQEATAATSYHPVSSHYSRYSNPRALHFAVAAGRSGFHYNQTEDLRSVGDPASLAKAFAGSSVTQDCSISLLWSVSPSFAESGHIAVLIP